MIDTTTQKPLQVHPKGFAGPYIRVLMDQLSEIRRLLDEHKVRYTVDEFAISYHGKPATTLIYLARHTDLDCVQAILDGNR